jgi:hypothetical protein
MKAVLKKQILYFIFTEQKFIADYTTQLSFSVSIKPKDSFCMFKTDTIINDLTEQKILTFFVKKILYFFKKRFIPNIIQTL